MNKIYIYYCANREQCQACLHIAAAQPEITARCIDFSEGGLVAKFSQYASSGVQTNSHAHHICQHLKRKWQRCTF